MIAEVSNMLIQPKDWIKVMCQGNHGKVSYIFDHKLLGPRKNGCLGTRLDLATGAW